MSDSTSTTTTSSSHCGVPEWNKGDQRIVEYRGRLFLTILNPFHSIWETPAVVSRSLSSHNSYSQASAKKPPLLFSDSLALSPLFSPLSSSHSASRPMSQRWAESSIAVAYGASIAFFHRCWEEKCEPGWESAGLQQASLPPTALPPTATRPVSSSAGRSEPAPPTHPHPPCSPTRLFFRVCDWFLGLPVSPWPHPPTPTPPSALTPSLSCWLGALVGTRQPLPGLAAKRLSESRQSNQSLLRSVLEWAGQSSAEQSSGRVIAASGTMVIGCLHSTVYIN